MTIRRKGAVAGAAAILLFFLPTTRWAQAETAKPPQYVLHVGTVAPEGFVWVKYVRKSFEEVTKRTGGRVRLEIATGGSMGDEPEIVEKMQKGELDGAGMTINGAHRLDRELSVLSLPYLFDSEREWLYVAGHLLEYFRLRLWDKGIHLVSIIIQGGAIQWYSTKGPKPLSELTQNETFWAWKGEPTMPMQYDAWGVRHTVPLNLGDVAEAMRSGRVSVIRTSGIAMVAIGWFPYVKTVYMVDSLFEPGVIVITRAAWEKLPQDVRGVFTDVNREFEPILNKRALHDDQLALLGMTKRYVDIVHPAPEEIAWLRERSQELWKRMEGKWFPPALFQRVIELREEYRRLKNP